MTVTAKPDFKEAEAQLSDPTQVSEMTKNGKMGEFIKDYADAKIAALGADIDRQVKDQVDQRFAGFGILFSEDVGCNLDEKAVEFAGVPFLEHGAHFVGAQAQPVAQEMVGLPNELHVSVLDAVMDHLDVVT